MADEATATQQGHEDRHAVGAGEADGGYACEAVEGCCGAEVDESQEGVDDGGEDEAPEGDFEAFVGAAEELGEGEGVVAGEGVDAAAGGLEGVFC